MSRILELRAPLELRPTPANRLPSAFDGVAYTGGIVPSIGAIIDLATLKVADRLPVLNEHERNHIIGAVTSTYNNGKRVTVAGRLFSDLPGGHAERIARLAVRGAPFQLSVGLYGYREEGVPPGTGVSVNGTTVVGPVLVLRGGTIREVSIVTLGADNGATARLFSSLHGPRVPDARDIYARRRREAQG